MSGLIGLQVCAHRRDPLKRKNIFLSLVLQDWLEVILIVYRFINRRLPVIASSYGLSKRLIQWSDAMLDTHEWQRIKITHAAWPSLSWLPDLYQEAKAELKPHPNVGLFAVLMQQDAMYKIRIF